MRICSFLIMASLFGFWPSSVSAQQDSIDVFVREQMQRRGIPGLQLAVVRNGKLVKTGNYGLANVQDSIPVNEKTLFTINSITKAFVGVAIMQLAEAGKLSLSSPISTYLKGLPESWNGVTVLQLLSHTSGIPDIVDEETVIIAANEKEAWQKVIALPMPFAKGERFAYCQTNYLLLGRIIDTLSGMPFSEFISREQLAKAGMVNTMRAGFGATKQVIAHAAGGYRYSNGFLTNMFFSMPPSLQTAAGMSSTGRELANWIIALQGGKLLKEQATLDLLWTPARLNDGNIAGFSPHLNGYAVGWPVAVRSSHPAAAAVGGARSALFVYFKDNLSIIVLTNLAGGFPEQFIDEIAGFYMSDMKEANGFGVSPSIHQLRIQLEKSGYKKAIGQANSLAASSKDFKLLEQDVNAWGYKLIGKNRILDALEIFKLNVYLFPTSANTFDSLGEVYAEIGEIKLAISNYEQSLKLDPDNRNAVEQLKRLRSNK